MTAHNLAVRLRLFVFVLLAIYAFADTGTADQSGLAAPQGQVLLTISGDIDRTNHDDLAIFDIGMLQELDQTTIATSTIWTDGVQDFTGVPLGALLRAVGVDPAETGSLRATAINDYAIEIPLSDGAEDHALVAFARNGAPMSIRDKGPLWIIYPFDESPKFQSEVYYSRSIWQLDRIEVVR